MGVFIGIIEPVTLVSELKVLGGHIVAHDVSACFLGVQTRGTQNECCVSMFCNWETFVADTQCF